MNTEAHIAVDIKTGVAHVVWTDDGDIDMQVATCGFVAIFWLDLVSPGEANEIYSFYPLDKDHLCQDCFKLF